MSHEDREMTLEEWCGKLPNSHLVNRQLKELLHHRDTTIGLWATDRPDLLTDEEKKKCYLFEIR